MTKCTSAATTRLVCAARRLFGLKTKKNSAPSHAHCAVPVGPEICFTGQFILSLADKRSCGNLADISSVCKAPEGWRTAMSSVKACVALRLFLFFPKSGLCFSFPASRFSKRFLGAVNGLGRCSSCYPCSAPRGRHQLTRAVTAKKRARPISRSGCCQPQCGSGRAPFQIVSVGLH